MSINITRPSYMSLRDWADQIVLDLDQFGSFGRLDDVTRWQDWASQIINNTDFKESIQSPYHFADWRDWAERFCQVLA